MEHSPSRDETVLVTGATGYLGGWCVAELLQARLQRAATVRDLAREGDVRATVGPELDGDGRLSLLAADLGADAGWAEAAEGCDYVLHVASPFPPPSPRTPTS